MLATTQALNSDFHVGSLSGRLDGRWGYGRLRRRPPVCVRLAKAAKSVLLLASYGRLEECVWCAVRCEQPWSRQRSRSVQRRSCVLCRAKYAMSLDSASAVRLKQACET